MNHVEFPHGRASLQHLGLVRRMPCRLHSWLAAGWLVRPCSRSIESLDHGANGLFVEFPESPGRIRDLADEVVTARRGILPKQVLEFASRQVGLLLQE